MSRIAVVGAGISGLATAWLLSRRHDVLVFEREARLGGHTHTHTIDAPGGPLRLDTGFIVHNDRTYPLLVRLFHELGVACQDSDMSFAVSDPATGFEYSTRNLSGLFAACDRLTAPDGAVLLQTITMNEQDFARYRGLADWMQLHVFPGSELTCLSEVIRSIGRVSAFRLFRVEDLGLHYARTLLEWRARITIGGMWAKAAWA